LEPQNQTTPHAETETGQSVAAQVDAYLKPYVDMQDFSGAVLIARGSRVLVNKAYGMANCELAVANTPQTRFRIASVSKQFTAAAVLLLEQRKLLSTDDTLAKFIPDFSHGKEITIHHLLTHTSGITGNMENLPEIHQDLQAFHPLVELAQMLKKSVPESPPGSRTAYSNKNYVLLAYIVEKVSGEHFGPFLRHNIFELLDMKDTGSEEYMEVIPHLATGYEPGVLGLDAAPIDDWWNNVGAGTIIPRLKIFTSGIGRSTPTLDGWLKKKGVHRVLARGIRLRMGIPQAIRSQGDCSRRP
jgi:CubicO group peptidase (beta-lactamase class C family)